MNMDTLQVQEIFLCNMMMCKQGCQSSNNTVKELRAIEIFEKEKNHYQLCLFLLINNIDRSNNNRNY